MRVATWNIRAGGGKRTQAIAQVLQAEAPDILVLTEFRPAPGAALLELLGPLDHHAVVGEPPPGVQGPVNCVCVLTRTPSEVVATASVPTSRHRWVSVYVPACDVTVLGAHVPNQTEIWNKRDFLACLEAFAMEQVGRRAVIAGDLNTALDEDCEGDPIREAVTLKRLHEAGWSDSWRQCNSDAREFSWYSHRSNGFRLDHCLVSPSLAGSVTASRFRHDVRTDGLSDHSLLVVDLEA